MNPENDIRAGRQERLQRINELLVITVWPVGNTHHADQVVAMVKRQPEKGVQGWMSFGHAAAVTVFGGFVRYYDLSRHNDVAEQRIHVAEFQPLLDILVIETLRLLVPRNIGYRVRLEKRCPVLLVENLADEGVLAVGEAENGVEHAVENNPRVPALHELRLRARYRCQQLSFNRLSLLFPEKTLYEYLIRRLCLPTMISAGLDASRDCISQYQGGISAGKSKT